MIAAKPRQRVELPYVHLTIRTQNIVADMSADDGAEDGISGDWALAKSHDSVQAAFERHGCRGHARWPNYDAGCSGNPEFFKFTFPIWEGR